MTHDRTTQPSQPHADEVGEWMSEANQRAVAFVRERPGAVLLGALCVGFVLGRILSRR